MPEGLQFLLATFRLIRARSTVVKGESPRRRRHRHRSERSFELRGVLHIARRVDREGTAVALCIIAGRWRPARVPAGWKCDPYEVAREIRVKSEAVMRQAGVG